MTPLAVTIMIATLLAASTPANAAPADSNAAQQDLATEHATPAPANDRAKIVSTERRGMILSTDHDSGVTMVQLPNQQELTVELPAATAATLRAGENVTVRMAFEPVDGGVGAGDTPPASAPVAMNTAKLPDELGHKVVTGNVLDVDRRTGHVVLLTSLTMLDLLFDPNMIQQLQKGDWLTVDIGISR